MFDKLKNVTHNSYKVYAIKDTLVGFGQPFIQPNDGTAVREFKNLVSLGSSAVSVNYRDMELYCLGSYNQDTGEITPEVRYLVKGADVKEVTTIENSKC